MGRLLIFVGGFITGAAFMLALIFYAMSDTEEGLALDRGK